MESIFQDLQQLLLILLKTVMMLVVVLAAEKQPEEVVDQQELTYEIPRRNASYKIESKPIYRKSILRALQSIRKSVV